VYTHHPLLCTPPFIRDAPLRPQGGGGRRLLGVTNDVADNLKANDLNDNIKANDVNDNIKAKDVNDNIKAKDVNDNIKAKDVNDNIKAKDVDDNIKAKDVNDNIKAKDVNDNIKAKDVNDNIKAKDVYRNRGSELADKPHGILNGNLDDNLDDNRDANLDYYNGDYDYASTDYYDGDYDYNHNNLDDNKVVDNDVANTADVNNAHAPVLGLNSEVKSRRHLLGYGDGEDNLDGNLDYYNSDYDYASTDYYDADYDYNLDEVADGDVNNDPVNTTTSTTKTAMSTATSTTKTTTTTLVLNSEVKAKRRLLGYGKDNDDNNLNNHRDGNLDRNIDDNLDGNLDYYSGDYDYPSTDYYDVDYDYNHHELDSNFSTTTTTTTNYYDSNEVAQIHGNPKDNEVGDDEVDSNNVNGDHAPAFVLNSEVKSRRRLLEDGDTDFDGDDADEHRKERPVEREAAQQKASDEQQIEDIEPLGMDSFEHEVFGTVHFENKRCVGVYSLFLGVMQNK
jgi:hypothetical protein